MKTKKIIAFNLVLILLSSCGNNNLDNKPEDKKTNKGHDHVLMEESHKEMDKVEESQKQYEAIQDKFAHQDIIILEMPYQVEAAENENFKNVISAYIVLKNLFIEEDLNKINKAISNMKDKVNKVSGDLMKNEGAKTWNQHAKLYNRILDEMEYIDALEDKRSYFSHISEIVYCTIKSFGFTNNQKLYATYCPMAFDGKGAYWVSETKEIENPYFGSKMLKCGEIEETMN